MSVGLQLCDAWVCYGSPSKLAVTAYRAPDPQMLHHACPTEHTGDLLQVTKMLVMSWWWLLDRNSWHFPEVSNHVSASKSWPLGGSLSAAIDLASTTRLQADQVRLMVEVRWAVEETETKRPCSVWASLVWCSDVPERHSAGPVEYTVPVSQKV